MAKRAGPNVETVLSDAVVSEYAVHAMCNYHNLHCAAEDLNSRGYFGLSRSIAIAAQEEFGKVAGSLGYLSGIISETSFRKGMHSHIRKLIWARACTDLAGHLKTLMPNTAAAAAATNDLLSMRHDVDADLPDLGHRVMTSAELLADAAALEPTITAIDRAEHEKLRQAGLYVNLVPTLDGYSVGHPGLVGAGEAAEQLEILRKFKTLTNEFAQGGELIEGPQVGWFDEATVKMLSSVLLGVAQSMRVLNPVQV